MARIICEGCDRKTPLFRDQIFSALEQRGLSPQTFIDADSKTRLELIAKHFQLTKSVSDEKPKSEPNNPVINLGMIIIKPEMLHAQKRVESFLSQNLGIKIVSLTDFIYTPTEYWNIHGKRLADYHDIFPHGALLFLISTTAPSKMILFEHQPVPEYEQIIVSQSKDSAREVFQEDQDPQRIFTQFFVRYGRNSLRGDVCRPEVSEKGLLTMKPSECPGMCWDFTASFCQRTEDQNARTFNGVHSPKDRSELASSLYVLRRVI